MVWRIESNFRRNEDEGPRAYIQTYPKTSVSAEEIHELISEKLPPYKRLSGGLSFIEKIPRNAVCTIPCHCIVLHDLQILTILFVIVRQGVAQ
ncbi:uncharacterized protein AKAW2_30105S [Aspergillus luchuensis]|uniref:Uncharacterized protein n=1 Tax=Aspergillus kawachii TaxID=1069201 RepID=A0A7R7ZX48_ASPKA|nr:uncharacterized protein AKAW2_30105S [Aspergillus luchuensis]BCR96786.1 hypothetical protein AKAW2_30105S [Aspergillus luchuensis]